MDLFRTFGDRMVQMQYQPPAAAQSSVRTPASSQYRSSAEAVQHPPGPIAPPDAACGAMRSVTEVGNSQPPVRRHRMSNATTLE